MLFAAFSSGSHRMDFVDKTGLLCGRMAERNLSTFNIIQTCTSTTLNHRYTCPTFNWTLFYVCAVARAHRIFIRMSLHIFLKPFHRV